MRRRLAHQDAAAEGREFALLFGATRRRIQTHLQEALRPWHMTGPRCGLLHFLSEKDGPTTSEIAERLNADVGMISRLVDAMVRAGLVRREHDPADRRAVRVHLTAAGKALQEEVAPVVAAAVAELLSVLSGEERTTLLGLLRRVAHAPAPKPDSISSIERE